MMICMACAAAFTPSKRTVDLTAFGGNATANGTGRDEIVNLNQNLRATRR